MSNDIILSIGEATTLGVRALRAIGFPDEQAQVITAHLVDAALCGYRFAGLPRILTINDSPRTHEPRSPVSVAHETEISALMDGGNNVGYYAVYQAMRVAIAKAKKSRIAIVGMYRSQMSGRNAYYLEHIAREGFVGIHLATGTHLVLPHGGAKPALGTNPIAFAFPGPKDPLIIDLGTAGMMLGEIILRARTAQTLPEGIAVDSQGAPTTDPDEALKGGVFAFGGHRGYALSLGIQAMCLLAGSARAYAPKQDYAFMFLVFDPEVLMPRGEFEAALQDLVENIRSTPPLDPGEPVRIPSERAFRERERNRRSGIPIAAEVHRQLVALAERLG
ncbi:MAG TPA: Ldh family oxidoreductase [Burkholderiales bacterium]|nr:Ldh family oxidoreductase [Burkholderiales bacterium]